MRTATSVREVVESGLCIGCGLCEAVTGGRVEMRMASVGAYRPSPVDGFERDEEQQILAACPGVVARPRQQPGWAVDPIWGAHGAIRYAWAGDPEIRFGASAGGVLTALGVHLVKSGAVDFVLHVGPAEGIENRWVISETAEEVVANRGSRYAPTAPLAGLGVALDRKQPFAVIAKPCDLGAVAAYADVDPRVDELCRYRLTMVCGGQSRRSKTVEAAAGFGVAVDEVASIRYRGHGNPGLTAITTRDGDVHELTYLDMWADESSWNRRQPLHRLP